MSTATKCAYSHNDANGAKLEIGDFVLVREGSAQGGIREGIIKKFTRTGITVEYFIQGKSFTVNRQSSQVLRGLRVQQERLSNLEKADLQLSLLNSHGVDNWEGYDDAMVEYNEFVKEVVE